MAARATGKTMTYLLRRRYKKRWRRVIMERTQPFKVNPRLAQVNELAYHIHDVYGIHDFVYRRSVNHKRLRKYKKVSKPPKNSMKVFVKNTYLVTKMVSSINMHRYKRRSHLCQ
jgi:hypothetical protein